MSEEPHHASYIDFNTLMTRNRKSNDKDFVLPTQYPKLSKRTKKKAPKSPESLRTEPYLSELRREFFFGQRRNNSRAVSLQNHV
jgi:hypothetical protein